MADGGGFGMMSQGVHEGIGGLTDLFGSFFQKNPYSKMLDEYGKMQGYITPYTDAGKQGLSGLQALLSGPLADLVKNPTGLEDKIMGQYSESPYAKEQTRQLQEAMGNQAAAAGNLGTPQAQQELAQRLQGVVSGDQQKYLQNAMQPFEFGLGQQQQGYGQQIGAGEFGTNMQNQFLESMANLIGGKDQWRNQRTQSQFGDIGSMLESPFDIGIGGAEEFTGDGGSGGMGLGMLAGLL